MQITLVETLISRGSFPFSAIACRIASHIREGIVAVHWPVGSGQFTINPTRLGNGVVPIKSGMMSVLADRGWKPEEPLQLTGEKPGPLDAVIETPDGPLAVE